ncbi:MAG: hypothetical protein R8P61_23160 [Bacteroidia bacterium]|nr:hypothetical protein [Bacteroidia bacterium]
MSKETENWIHDAMLDFIINAKKESISDLLDESYEDEAFEALEKRKAFIRRLQFTSKAIANRENQKQLLSKVAKILKKGLEEHKGKPIQKLKDILETKQSLSFQFRNLEKLSEENIIELLVDINLVELLDELTDET